MTKDVTVSLERRFWARCLAARELVSNEWIFYIVSYVWLWTGWSLSQLTDTGQLWVPLAGGILLGLPFYLARLYLCTIKKTFLAHQFRDKSILKTFWSGRTLSVIFWIPVSLVSGICLLYLLHSLTVLEWVVVVASVPILRCLAIGMTAIARSQYQEYLAFSKGLFWAQILCALALVGLLAAAQPYFFPVVEAPLLSEVMLEQGKVPLSADQSVIAQVLNRYSLYFDTASTLALKFLSGDIESGHRSIFAIPLLLAPLSVPFAVSAFLISAREYQRLLMPLTETSVTTEITFKRSATVTTMAVIVLLFFYPGLAIPFDQYLKDRLRDDDLDNWEIVLHPRVEAIEGRFFKSGTGEALEELQAELFNNQPVDKRELERQLDYAYNQMAKNIDNYLDEYYSLAAEYVRMGSALTGSLEAHIRRELKNTLAEGKPFAQFEQTFQGLASRHELALKEFEEKRNQLLRENEVLPPMGDFWEIKEISQAQFHPPAPEVEYLDGTLRASGSAGAGAVSAVVAGKVASKMAAKGALKFAATAITKTAASKIGAGAAGTAAGAAIGSVVPIAGTAIGALVGLGVGLAVGASVDAAMLGIEEHLSRDKFRQQIRSSLLAAKAEHKQRLGL